MLKQNKKIKSRLPYTEGITEIGKVQPQSRDFEEAVLGAMMLEKNALNDVIDILKVESFYVDAHQKIFSVIHDLFQQSQPIDILTVTEELRKRGELEIIGGAYYISLLTNRVASSANIQFHARVIAQKHILRELIRISSETARDAYEESADVFELLDKAEKDLFSVAQGNIRKNWDSMSDIIKIAIEQIEAAKKNQDGVSGVPSGFTDLDRITAGWQKSDMVIIAARPGMGKCLGKGTKILMFDGSLKKVEEVVAGELLMGDDSTPRKVLSIARGREKMYWIHQNTAVDYRVNESHILSLKRSRNDGKHKQGNVLNITVKEYLEKSNKFKSNYKGYKVAVNFDEKELPLEPYYLGLWLGDGHSYSQRITNIDKEIITYLNQYANKLSSELVEYTQENRTANYSIINRNKFVSEEFTTCIQTELRTLGLIKNKHIPDVYLINSTKNRLELLAGLIDSDGYYTTEFNCFEVSQKSENLINQIKFLCDSLGFRTSVKKKKTSIKTTGFVGEAYRLRIFGNLNEIPTKIARKKAREWNSLVDWTVTGITVAYDKVDDYYGFEIDGNRLFLLEDMTVTHNTAFVLSMARNIAVDFQRPVAVFSLEMSSTQLVNRLISSETGIPAEKLRKGNLEDYEFEQLHARIKKLTKAPIYLDDTPALSIFELRAKARRLKAKHNIEIIIIDYLQLMSAGVDRGNREQEISNISRAIKTIAKELDIPIIALSQLSRAVETRGGDKRPMLSDLRESGAIEQDADLVAFIYRAEYYKIMVDADNNPTDGIGEIIIAKHRNGALDNVRLKFTSYLAKFSNLDNYDNNNPEDQSMQPNNEFENFTTITRPSKMNELSDDDMGNFTGMNKGEDAPF